MKTQQYEQKPKIGVEIFSHSDKENNGRIFNTLNEAAKRNFGMDDE